MSTYTIGEVADRSGFSASALRYYEEIGLVPPADRSLAGYRLYDEATLGRLAFIARAKQLGCSLEEITDLVGVWDGQRCGPVQRRFHELVTDKIRAAQQQIVELSAFSAQLVRAAEQLSGEPTDGPCAVDCACVTGVASPPIACSLENAALPERLAAWHAMLNHAPARTATADGGLRIELGTDVDVGELAQLVVAEQRCCTFFSFAITVDGRGIALEVRVPDDASGVVADLFGTAA